MFNQIALLALAAFVGMASADKTEFPLVYVCLGITIVGIIIALYVAYKRPDELYLPNANEANVQSDTSDSAAKVRNVLTPVGTQEGQP